MKDRPRVLLNLADEDSHAAQILLQDFPNLAAFHAQQCVEKCAKALLTEISNIDEDLLRKKIKHDSILAVMRVLSETLKRVAKESGMDSLHENNRKLKKEGKQGWQYAWLITSAFDYQFSMVVGLLDGLFEQLKLPYLKSDDFWAESLDPTLEAKPKGNPKWLDAIDQIRDDVEASWQSLLMMLGLNENQFPELMQLAKDMPHSQARLQGLAISFRAQGKGNLADSIEKAISKLDIFLSHESAFMKWLQLILAWSPYLDSHAIRARYPSGRDLDVYRKNKDAVGNLINHSAEILNLTRNAIHAVSYT